MSPSPVTAVAQSREHRPNLVNSPVGFSEVINGMEEDRLPYLYLGSCGRGALGHLSNSKVLKKKMLHHPASTDSPKSRVRHFLKTKVETYYQKNLKDNVPGLCMFV